MTATFCILYSVSQFDLTLGLLTLRLLTGYEMYPDLEFSLTILAGTE
jgi:hypothetical protein